MFVHCTNVFVSSITQTFLVLRACWNTPGDYEDCLEVWHLVLWMSTQFLQKVSFSKKLSLDSSLFRSLFMSLAGCTYVAALGLCLVVVLIDIISFTTVLITTLAWLITLHIFVVGSVIRVFSVIIRAIFTSLQLTVNSEGVYSEECSAYSYSYYKYMKKYKNKTITLKWDQHRTVKFWFFDLQICKNCFVIYFINN